MLSHSAGKDGDSASGGSARARRRTPSSSSPTETVPGRRSVPVRAGPRVVTFPSSFLRWWECVFCPLILVPETHEGQRSQTWVCAGFRQAGWRTHQNFTPSPSRRLDARNQAVSRAQLLQRGSGRRGPCPMPVSGGCQAPLVIWGRGRQSLPSFHGVSLPNKAPFTGARVRTWTSLFGGHSLIHYSIRPQAHPQRHLRAFASAWNF